MLNKEQLLYFFLQGKISLSQYDYKFMANLQTIIQNNSRITSNQAALFDKLLVKYSKQLRKLDLNPTELLACEWKTMLVESTDEYTGASVLLTNDEITIKVPFNKNFINFFRTKIENNPFHWDKEVKLYRAAFSTTALKITTRLKDHFSSVRYCANLQCMLDEIKKYDSLVWNPTLVTVNDRFVIGACPQAIGEIIENTKLNIDASTLFKLSTLGIKIDPSVYQNDELLNFAASRVYSTDITHLNEILDWMKVVGCETVIIGRGMRVKCDQVKLDAMIAEREMKSAQHTLLGVHDEAEVAMLIQHTSNVDSIIPYRGNISKTVVLKDSRPLGAV